MRAKVATLCCGSEYRSTLDARTDIQRFNTKRLRGKSASAATDQGIQPIFSSKLPSCISFGVDNRDKRYLDDPTMGIHTLQTSSYERDLLLRISKHMVNEVVSVNAIDRKRADALDELEPGVLASR